MLPASPKMDMEGSLFGSYGDLTSNNKTACPHGVPCAVEHLLVTFFSRAFFLHAAAHVTGVECMDSTMVRERNLNVSSYNTMCLTGVQLVTGKLSSRLALLGQKVKDHY